MKKAKGIYLTSKLFRKNIDMIPTRTGYGEGLVEAGNKDENVWVLCCDLTDSTNHLVLQKNIPKDL